MILIPGLMFTNCIREMISENMLSGLTRLLECIIYFFSIAIGFAIAYYLRKRRLVPLNPYIQIIAAFFGSLGFAAFV